MNNSNRAVAVLAWYLVTHQDGKDSTPANGNPSQYCTDQLNV